VGAGTLVVALLVAVVVAVLPDDREPVAQPADTTTSPPAPWLSGVSGESGAAVHYGEWRGRPVDIIGAWSDDNERMTELQDLQPDGGLANWDKSVDIAIGAIGEGESWQEAAKGQYDSRWLDSLTVLRDLRSGRTGTTFIRFAHEMNGDWYPWSVDTENKEAFVAAWLRFRELQQDVFPDAQLVFCVNRESVNTGMDWRNFFPGPQYVDVIGVDYYNNAPYVSSTEEWQASLDDMDEWGAPKGLRAHLEFARSVGLPLAVPEWSGDATEGDSPAFIEGMYRFFEDHGGDGPGQLLYEIQFNSDKDDGKWVLFDEHTKMPESAETYQQLW